MQRLKNFNNISDELFATIPPLKEGEIKSFRMLTGTTNPDPDFDERQKQPILYGGIQIQTKDRIKDKWKRNEKGEVVGGFVDIGVVESFDPVTENVIKTRLFVSPRGVGTFVLSGDKIEDVELYEFLYLTNQNSKNNKTNDALFEEVVFQDESEQELNEFEARIKAFDVFSKLEHSEYLKVAAAFKIETSLSEKDLRISVGKKLESNPNKFIEVVKLVTKAKEVKRQNKLELQEA